jgi:hypothetical protein
MKSPPATGTVGVFNVGHPITVDGKTFFGVEIDGVSFSAPIFQVVADTPPFSVPGDSGSVICDLNDNVVSLMFSSKPDGTSALAFHIQPVLDALNPNPFCAADLPEQERSDARLSFRSRA